MRIPESKPRIERAHGLARIVGKPEANYTLLYGNHVTSDSLSRVPNCNGIFLETGLDDYTLEPARVMHDYAIGNGIMAKQFQGIIQAAQDKDLPIYFADFSAAGGLANVGEAIEAATQTAIGAILAGDLIKAKLQHKVDRRTIAKGALGAWLFSPVAMLGGRAIGLQTGVGENVSASLPKINEKMSPQFLFLTSTVRNTIFAHKEEYIARLRGDKPELVTTIGGNHTGLEDQLLHTPEQRLEFLRAIAPYLKKVKNNTFFTVTEMRYKEVWYPKTVHELPELKAMLK